MAEEQHFWVGVNLSADGGHPEGVYTPAAFEVVDGSTVRTWGSPALDPVLREAIGRALGNLGADAPAPSWSTPTFRTTPRFRLRSARPAVSSVT